jgi:hypothetical protein
VNSEVGQGESPMDESKFMSAETCAKYILNAIEKKKGSCAYLHGQTHGFPQ